MAGNLHPGKLGWGWAPGSSSHPPHPPCLVNVCLPQPNKAILFPTSRFRCAETLYTLMLYLVYRCTNTTRTIIQPFEALALTYLFVAAASPSSLRSSALSSRISPVGLLPLVVEINMPMPLDLRMALHHHNLRHFSVARGFEFQVNFPTPNPLSNSQ